MAVDLKQQLDRVSVKAQIITGRYLSLRKQLDEANTEISRLSATIGQMQTEIEKLKLANEYLRLAACKLTVTIVRRFAAGVRIRHPYIAVGLEIHQKIYACCHCKQQNDTRSPPAPQGSLFLPARIFHVLKIILTIQFV